MGRFFKVVGYTMWGDVVAVYGSCETLEAPALPRYPLRGEARAWRLSPSVLAMLDGLKLGAPRRQRAYGHAVPQ